MAGRPRCCALPVPRPTCGGCPALGSGHPGASHQLVLKQLLVEAIFGGVTAHQEQGEASAGSEGVAGNCRQLHSLRNLGDKGQRSPGSWGLGVIFWVEASLRTPGTPLELIRRSGPQASTLPWSQQVCSRRRAISACSGGGAGGVSLTRAGAAWFRSPCSRPLSLWLCGADCTRSTVGCVPTQRTRRSPPLGPGPGREYSVTQDGS